MQNPMASTSLSSFLSLLDKSVRARLPKLQADDATDLASFYQFLGATNDHLETTDRRLLIGIDEYENLDRKIAEGVFPEDLLATFRESIQTHRRIIWLFTGSHHITELTNAPWPSYFVSVRTVELEPFSDAETRLLLTDPLKSSPLFRRDESKRPRFDPSFWGEGGIEHIQAEAAGWPHLVQLLAETAVDLVNMNEAPGVDAALMEKTLATAIKRGDMVLRELMHGESRLPGEWDYLCGFLTRDSQPPPDDPAIFRSLKRWELITVEGDEWRLRVPLMQRGLRERG
jgi:hypothetical protein